jgi:hypothetical protein
VRKLLAQIDKRSMGRVDLVDGKGVIGLRSRRLAGRTRESRRRWLKATSRAIERVLNLALFFEGQGIVGLGFGRGV